MVTLARWLLLVPRFVLGSVGGVLGLLGVCLASVGGWLMSVADLCEVRGR